jgi:hypothetical protein
MLDLAVAADLAVRSTRRTAGSALPDAPVVAPRERVPTHTRARASLAAGLHRIASALEPKRKTAPACR